MEREISFSIAKSGFRLIKRNAIHENSNAWFSQFLSSLCALESSVKITRKPGGGGGGGALNITIKTMISTKVITNYEGLT